MHTSDTVLYLVVVFVVVVLVVLVFLSSLSDLPHGNMVTLSEKKRMTFWEM